MGEFGKMQECYFGVGTFCEQKYSENDVKQTYIDDPDANGDPCSGLDGGVCPVLAGNPLGNWDTFKQGDGGGTWDLDQSRAHNKANEIDSITRTTGASWPAPDHDAAGNMIQTPRPLSLANSFDLKWDAWNRLVAVTARGTNIAFAYDGQHKRITKTASSITRHFYYSVDWQILEERLDEETEPLRQYVWNPNPNRMDDLVLRDEGAEGSGSSSSGTQERLYALNDLMNVTAIVDDDGNVVERYGYTPFGESRVMDAGFGPRSSSDYDWELRYKTYPLDLESGLYQVRHRYLHPGLGRWMSRDPIGYRGGLNLYAFVGNDPVNRWDYLGLSCCGGKEMTAGQGCCGGVIKGNVGGRRNTGAGGWSCCGDKKVGTWYQTPRQARFSTPECCVDGKVFTMIRFHEKHYTSIGECIHEESLSPTLQDLIGQIPFYPVSTITEGMARDKCNKYVCPK